MYFGIDFFPAISTIILFIVSRSGQRFSSSLVTELYLERWLFFSPFICSCFQESDVQKLENKINSGQIEEVILQVSVYCVYEILQTCSYEMVLYVELGYSIRSTIHSSISKSQSSFHKPESWYMVDALAVSWIGTVESVKRDFVWVFLLSYF